MARIHWKSAKSSFSDVTGEWKRGFGLQGGRLRGESVMAIEYTEEGRVRGDGCVSMT